MLKLLALIAPLAIDTFVVACAVGAAPLDPLARRRVALTLAGCEVGMPLVGLGLGAPLATLVGGAASYVAAAVLVSVGAYMTLEHGEKDGVAGRTVGWPLVLLGLSVSLDELVVGLGFGTLGVSLIPALVLIVAQAWLAAWAGLRLGAAISTRAREWAERAAGVLLIAVGLAIALQRVA